MAAGSLRYIKIKLLRQSFSNRLNINEVLVKWAKSNLAPYDLWTWLLKGQFVLLLCFNSPPHPQLCCGRNCMFFIYVLFSAHIHSLHSFLQVLFLFCAAVKWDRAELSTGETKQIPPADRETHKQLLGKQIFPDPRPPKKKQEKKVSSGHTRHLWGGPRAEDGGTRSDIVALGCLRGLGITAFTGMCFCSLPLYLLVPLSRWLLPQTDPPGKIID